MTVERTETITETDGERRVFHSLEEAPPEVRAKIEELRAHPEGANVSETFIVRDDSGRERTYHSLEEMPPEIRAVMERLQREGR